MAAVQDTFQITPQNLTLTDFTLWDLPGPRLQREQKIDQLRAAAENYSWASNDLVNLCQNGPTRNDLARLLQYYAHGMRRAYNAATDQMRNSPSGTNLFNFLNLMDNNLLASAIALPPFPAAGNQFQIPNGSVTELLVKSRFENVPAPPPTTLVTFQNMITQLTFCTQNNNRILPGLPVSTFNGLPYVLFTCVSHTNAAGPLCIVGTSLDQWAAKFLTRVSQAWRRGRFPAGAPATLQLQQDGATIKAKYDSVAPSPPPVNMVYANFNQINTDMFTLAGPPAPLPQQFGFLCGNEAGRSFAGRPLNGDPNRTLQPLTMYQEMCRCWKCRYLHHYDTNAGVPPAVLQAESYTQTSLYCNPAMFCAEDLVQSQCAALRPGGAVGPAIAPQPQPIV